MTEASQNFRKFFSFFLLLLLFKHFYNNCRYYVVVDVILETNVLTFSTISWLLFDT